MADLLSLIALHPELTRTTATGVSVAFVPFSEVDGTVTSAYAVPYLSRNQCLAVQRQDGNWMIPGGTIKPGETWQEALLREILEETGARVDRFEPVGAYRLVGSTTTYRIFSWAEITIVGAPVEPDSGSSSIVESRTVTPTEALELFTGEFTHLRSVYALVDAIYQATDS